MREYVLKQRESIIRDRQDYEMRLSNGGALIQGTKSALKKVHESTFVKRTNSIVKTEDTHIDRHLHWSEYSIDNCNSKQQDEFLLNQMQSVDDFIGRRTRKE